MAHPGASSSGIIRSNVRTEQEMMDLVLGFAREHDDVRAVVMTGSRANPAIISDPLQDYDITYFVRDVTPYRHNWHVPEYFGDIMILQTPDEMDDAPADSFSYAFLMQFADGNRIDLTFCAVDDTESVLGDSLSVVLLDKDERIKLPPPSIESYLPEKPTGKQFADCCNEFWWLNPYVAKGLYRDQVTYAKAILDGPMREQLMTMLVWHVGLKTAFSVSPGYLGKHLKTQLDPELWQLLERTYSDARPNHIWRSLFAMGELFRTVARPVAGTFQFTYPDREDSAVSSFIRRIRSWRR